jgi:hypothetical protein
MIVFILLHYVRHLSLQSIVTVPDSGNQQFTKLLLLALLILITDL